MLNILITGANGQLGSSLRRLGGVSPHNYFCTDVAELDITDAAAVLLHIVAQDIHYDGFCELAAIRVDELGFRDIIELYQAGEHGKDSEGSKQALEPCVHRDIPFDGSGE